MSQGYIRPAFKAEARKVEETAQSELARPYNQREEQVTRERYGYGAEGQVTYEHAKLLIITA